MLDKYINILSDSISYKTEELEYIKEKSNKIFKTLESNGKFKNPFIGGSYQRDTIVKNIGSIDLYIKYEGNNGPKKAVDNLKKILKKNAIKTSNETDTCFVKLEYEDQCFTITPYKSLTNKIAVPSIRSNRWQIVDEKLLNLNISELKEKNPNYIKLIKVLKMWNKTHGHQMSSKEIEEKSVKLFINETNHFQNISDYLWLFFVYYGYDEDAKKVSWLKKIELSEDHLELEWKRFILNK